MFEQEFWWMFQIKGIYEGMRTMNYCHSNERLEILSREVLECELETEEICEGFDDTEYQHEVEVQKNFQLSLLCHFQIILVE